MSDKPELQEENLRETLTLACEDRVSDAPILAFALVSLHTDGSYNISVRAPSDLEADTMLDLLEDTIVSDPKPRKLHA